MAETSITSIGGRVFPPVTTRLCRVMQPTPYLYLWQVSASQQIRLIVLSVTIFPLSMAPLELQRNIIDRAISGADFDLLLRLGVLYLAVLLVHGALKYAFQVYQAVVAEGVVRVLRRRVANEAERGDFGEGAQVSMTVAEVEQFGGFVAEGVALPVLQGGIFLTVITYMLVVEPLVAAVALVFLAPSVLLTPKIQSLINRYVERRIALLRELGDEIAEADETWATDESTHGPFNALIERIYRTRFAIFRLKFGLKAMNNFLGNLGPLSILLFGGWMVIEGETQIGTLVAFFAGFERLADPSRQLLNFYRTLSRLRVQYRLLADKLD